MFFCCSFASVENSCALSVYRSCRILAGVAHTLGLLSLSRLHTRSVNSPSLLAIKLRALQVCLQEPNGSQ